MLALGVAMGVQFGILSDLRRRIKQGMSNRKKEEIWAIQKPRPSNTHSLSRTHSQNYFSRVSPPESNTAGINYNLNQYGHAHRQKQTKTYIQTENYAFISHPKYIQ